MFQRLLIANRGEIALRIMRSARALGIECAVVYAASEAGARHVREADVALPLTGFSARDSYLDCAQVVAAAERFGADAVHPGYGFLSENAEFAAAVEAAGMAFVGPPPEVIAAMGSKETAKVLATQAGVPVIPGSDGAMRDPEALLALAATLSFPLLIKAALGGGGRGLRRVDRIEDFAAALASAQREALSAFGDDAMLLERFLDGCRHVEVQILADQHGRVRHLYDRDCSLQRRHQKVVEEAPAFGLSRSLRSQMLGHAVRLAEQVGYRNAGTVEFAVLGDEAFFLEMNTRLQVEHPVTEAVTGLDLVAWQLRIAAGEALDFEQSAVTCDGHAVEARVYAEDPAQRFMPSTGQLQLVRWPEDVRVDTGISSGDAVTEYFDPMVAKVIVTGRDRPAALRRLERALAAARVAGVTTNLSYLGAVLAREEVQAALHNTTTLGDWSATAPEAELVVVLAASVLAHPDGDAGSADIGSAWAVEDGFRLNQPARFQRRWHLGGVPVCVEVSGDQLVIHGDHGAQNTTIERIGSVHTARMLRGSRDACGLESLDIEVDGEIVRVERWLSDGRCTLWLRGRCYSLQAPAIPLPQSLAAAGGREVRAPMTGQLIAVRVKPGDEVAADSVVAVLEAMKMEHELRTPLGGVVADVPVSAGDAVAADSLIVSFVEEA